MKPVMVGGDVKQELVGSSLYNVYSLERRLRLRNELFGFSRKTEQLVARRLGHLLPFTIWKGSFAPFVIVAASPPLKALKGGEDLFEYR